MAESVPNPNPDRRSFFKKIACVVLGAAAILPAMVAGLAVLTDPLRRKGGGEGQWVRAASLAAVPNDGVPRIFTLSATLTDAWNKYPNVPIGAVYLRRTGPASISAFNAICPHAGGFIDYQAGCHCFICPLHNSQFRLDGSIRDLKSPSPRPMDALPVEIRGDEVWVRFENFLTGMRKKIPA